MCACVFKSFKLTSVTVCVHILCVSVCPKLNSQPVPAVCYLWAAVLMMLIVLVVPRETIQSTVVMEGGGGWMVP